MPQVTEEQQADPRRACFLCKICGFVYDASEGDLDSGIEPGTPFEELPPDWFCPVCGAMTQDFRKLEPGEETDDFDMPSF